MDVDQLTRDLLRDEALRLKPYKDSEGILTIGIGRNLEDRGISEDEAFYLNANDVKIVEEELDQNVPWWRTMHEPAQRALANMCFNLGWPRLSQFRMMLAALEAGDYVVAATEALDSKWARQVGERAQRIATRYMEE